MNNASLATTQPTPAPVGVPLDSGRALLAPRDVATLQWRCRRGLLENDLFIERFFAAHGATLTEADSHVLTALMDLPDNDLLDLLLRRSEPSGDLASAEVRRVLELLRRPPATASFQTGSTS